MTADGEQDFDVRATTVGGEDVSVSGVKAPSVETLLESFRSQGRQVSSVRLSRPRRLFDPRGVNPEEFAVFNTELAAACKRNVPLPAAIRALSGEMGGRRFRRALEEVTADLESGADFADALARHPRAFPPAYVAMLKAGIKTGNLGAALLVFSQEARLTARVRRRTAAALGYPLTMLIVTSIVMALLGSTLVPFIDEFFGPTMREQLPSGTRLLLSCASAMTYAPILVLTPLLVGFIAWCWTGSKSGSARFLGALRLRVPLVGGFLRAVAMTRLCRTLASALKSGVPVPESVALAGLATGNAAIQEAANQAAAAIREGHSISEGLQSSSRGLLPSTLIWMLSMGEARSDVAPALEEYAAIQEESADRIGRSIPVIFGTIVILLSAGMLFFGITALMKPMMDMLVSLSESAF